MITVLMLLCSLFMVIDTSGVKAEEEVTAAMNAWKQAMLARDRTALEAMYAPGLMYFHSNGKQENKAEAIEAVVAGQDRYESIDLKDMSVTLYGDTALVKAKVILRINKGTATDTITLDVLHVWIKAPKGWQMVARHAARLNPV